MQVRLGTISVTDEQRRAVRFTTSKKRTRATRDEVRKYLEHAVHKALAELDYRWSGDQASTVDPEVAIDVSEAKNGAPEQDATPA
jgi:hypothetical protein